MQLLSVVDTKPIDMVTKLNGALNHKIKGVPPGGIVDNEWSNSPLCSELNVSAKQFLRWDVLQMNMMVL
jgi:hypothetical protein